MAEFANIEFVPKVHSEWGASGYHRWSASLGGCPGSVRLIREKAPPELLIDDEVKDDGIEAHGIAEAWLRERDRVRRAVLKARAANNGADFKMLNDVHKYVTYVDELATLPGAELLVEQSFDLSWLCDGLFGTTDAIVYAPFSDYWDLETQTLHKGPTLHVIDLKYGFAEVDADENPQALYYALGAYAHYRSLGKEVKRIVVHIFQPRVIGRKSAPVRWSCDEAYLERFAANLKDDKLATDDPDAPLVPKVDHCRLCKARTICPELVKPAWHAARLQILSLGGDPRKTIPTYEQGHADPGTLYMIAGLAKKWAESTMERTRAEMQQGKKIESLKLVAGKNARVFKDPSKVTELYPREEWPELYEEPELRSVSQVMEKLQELNENGTLVPPVDLKDFEKKLVVKLPGAPLVALESDPREEYSTVNRARNEWADELKPAAPPPPPSVDYGVAGNFALDTLGISREAPPPPPPPAVVYDAAPVVTAAPPPPPASVEFDPAAFFNPSKQG